MKLWTKLEISLLSDARIVRLIDEQGMKGFGLYCMLHLRKDCQENSSFEDLLNAGARYTSRRITTHILNDFGLFDFAREQERALVPASVRAPARTSVRECVPASEPISNPIEEKNRTMISMIKSWLLTEDNLIWREPMIMQSGYAPLLQQHWPEAVAYFIQHMLAQDKLLLMYNAHEAKRYFTNFSRVTCTTGHNLRDHLQSLNAGQTTQGYQDSDAPAGAPPRPSATAQWNYATEQWVEIRKVGS